MTAASNQIITRCPKCGTAFRVTPSQLQSAKGAVRCGSCLHVFKAQEYAVEPASSKTTPTAAVVNEAVTTTEKATTVGDLTLAKPAAVKTQVKPSQISAPVVQPANKPATPTAATILSSIKPLTVDVPPPAAAKPAVKPATPPVKKPVVRTIDKSSLSQADDILISDDMEDSQAEAKSYDFDGFVDIDTTPKSDVTLFERKIRNKDDEDEPLHSADESWAEMLIDDEDDTPKLGIAKPKTEEQLADDELLASGSFNTGPVVSAAPPSTPTTPGLMFSLISEKEDEPGEKPTEDFILSDELANIPSNQGFNHKSAITELDPNLFETPDDNVTDNSDDQSSKRQVKAQPKIRAYDGSRAALLMNIIPAPIEFNAKRMRRWYQRKLWPTLSVITLIALIIQVGWFKFDYFSRVEPYRTGYLFLCPYLGCQVPTLVDTSRIVASNLVVREHPDTQGALAVDVMIINGAPFEQPFPDLVLVFTNIDEKQVASRRFTPKDYLGGELVGRELMPQNQKIHITLDLVDPGAEAVNYHIYIPR
ncbi:MAG TPA: DUF3426 domain-containing protein [Cellvibrio sp.]|nr:DUF3426 domain-containing protein [Cellvibrio sp.]